MSLLLLRLQKLAYALRRPRLLGAFWRTKVLPTVDLLPLLQGEFATIIDVGANRGQFAILARNLWPNARIYSFEPGPRAAKALRRLFERDEMLEINEVALGAAPDHRTLRIPNADDGASFLIPVDSIESVNVAIKPLDSLRLPTIRPVLLKMDVQGFELEVLRGAEETLQQVDVIVSECTYTPPSGVPSAMDLCNYLQSRGFRLAAAVASGPYGDLRFERAD